MKTKLSKTIVKQFLLESNAIEDVWDHKSFLKAQSAWNFLLTKDKLDDIAILEAHKILMTDHLPREERGSFRKCAVYIGGREGSPWYAVPELMAQWIVNANDVVVNGQHENQEFLETVIKQQHVLFERIHPFIDGNGRMGRLLLNWQRVYTGLDMLVIKNSEKYSYYDWFKF